MHVTGRTDFNKTWLTEMPEGLGSFHTFNQLEYNINDLKKNNIPVEDLGSGLKKIELDQTVYYWYENSDMVLLGVELDKRPQGWVVRLTGKNPKILKSPPFASDLYDAVLRDNKHRSIRILSDVQLSDEGYDIWKKLFAQGHKISVYDRTIPGKSFQTFTSMEDFDKYFKHDDSEYKKYQYVISESGSMIAETRSHFSTRRYRELSGLSLED
jgi:hypothetical protein